MQLHTFMQTSTFKMAENVWLLSAVIVILIIANSEQATAQNCVTSVLSPLNPGTYYPTQMTPLICQYQCSAYVNTSNAAAVAQSSVCLCEQGSTSVASNICNSTCSGNNSISCGDQTGSYANEYPLPCGPSVTNVVSASAVISSVLTSTQLSATYTCKGPTTNGSVAVSLDNRYPSETYTFNTSSSAVSATTLNYAYIAPGYAVWKSTVTTPNGDTSTNTKVVQIQQNIGQISPIPLNTVLYGIPYTMQISISVVSSADMYVSLGNGITQNSSLLASVTSSVGDLNVAQSNITSGSVYLIPSLTVKNNMTITDVRLNLVNSFSAAGNNIVYLQIYRPLCTTGSVFCYLTGSCISATTNCSTTAGNTMKTTCSGDNIYSSGNNKCVNQMTNTTVQNAAPNALGFTSYFLQYDIPINLTAITLSKLSLNGNKYFANLASLGITLQAGDVPAVFQPDSLSYMVAFGNGSSLSVQGGSITNFQSRATVAAYKTYPTITFTSNNAATISGVPLISLSFARSINASITFTYPNHSCAAFPYGCYREDLYDFSVNVINPISSSSVMNTIHVQLPISNVTFTQPSICPTFTSCNLTINPHIGSIPQYAISFGDYQGNVSNMSLQANQTKAQHFYTLAGDYTTTVYAFNVLTQQTVQQPVTVMDFLAGLRIIPNTYPAGLIGQQFQITVAVAQGSNASYSLSFGDGSSPINFNLNPSLAPFALSEASYFIPIPLAGVRLLAGSVINAGGLGLQGCAQACLQSTADNFTCQLFVLDGTQTFCTLYSTVIYLFSAQSVTWNQLSTVYALQNSSCYPDLLQSIQFSSNATFGSTANIQLNSSSPWDSTSTNNQSIMFAFSSFVQIYVVRVKPSSTIKFAIYSSNDTFTWLLYNSSAGISTYSLNVSTQSKSIVLNPPILTRFLNVYLFNIAVKPAARFGFSGCLVQSAASVFNYTYSSSQFNQTSVLNITVNSSNSLNAASASLPYFIDVPISNLTLQGLVSNLFTYTNNTLPFQVTGVWGSYLEIIITRQDGVVLINTTFIAFNPVYNFSVLFTDPGLWYLTVTASNYAGQSSYALMKAVVAIQYIGAGCNAPYVDLTIPNGCVLGVSCDPKYATLNALKNYRGNIITVQSNTTNYCERPAIFTWTVQSCNSSGTGCVDYSQAISSVYSQRYPNLAPVSLNGTQLFTLTFQPRSFHIGLYKFSLTVTIPGMVSQTSQYQYVQALTASSAVYYSVVQTPLSACANNFAFSIPAAWDPTYNVTLDATCSSDPDLWPEEQTNLNYYWSCFRSCENSPNYNANMSFIPWTSETYATSCPSISPELKNMSVSNEGCFVPYGVHKSGPLTPHSRADWNGTLPNNSLTGPFNPNASLNSYFASNNYWLYETAPDNSTVMLSTYSMFFLTQHYFILTVGKYNDSRHAQVLIVVNIAAVLPPALKATCVSNCYNPAIITPVTAKFIVDPNASFKLLASILNYNPISDYTYMWTMCVTSGARSQAITYGELISILSNPANCSLTTYDWTHASTSYNSPGVSFDTNYPVFDYALQEKLIALVVNVSVMDFAGPRFSTAYFLFIVNSPPSVSDVRIMAFPTNGVGLSTNFSVFCSDGSSNSPPLRYSIGFSFYVPSNLTPSAALTAGSSCQWMTNNQRACSLPGSVFLPPGNTSMNNTLFLCIAITDDVGSFNYSFAPAVQVTPLALTAAQLQSTSSLTSLQQMASNNPFQFQSYVVAVMGTINPPTFTSYSSSATITVCSTNMTCPTTAPAMLTTTTPISPALQQAKVTLVSNVLTAMTNLPTASDVDTLVQYASVANVVTQNPSLMQTQSNTQALTVAISLGNSLVSLTSTTSSSTNQIELAGSQITTILNNVLVAAYSEVQILNASVVTSTPGLTQSLQTQSNLITQGIRYAAASALARKVPGEKMSIIGSTLGVQVFVPENLASQVLTINESSCTKFMMGSVDFLFAPFANGTPASVQLSTTQMLQSQFLWLPEATNMNQSQSMEFSNNGAFYNVTNASGSRTFEIWLDTALQPSSIQALNANYTPYTLPLSQNMLMHKVNTKAKSNLFINIQHYLNYTLVPRNVTVNGSVTIQYDTILQNNASYNGSNIMFIVYVKKSSKPTDTDYTANCTLPNFDVQYLSCAAQALNLSATGNVSVSSLYQLMSNQTNSSFYDTLRQVPNRCSRFSQTQMNPWTCMFTSSQINNTNDSIYYVGVRALMWNWTLPVVNGSYDPNATSPSAPTSNNAADPGPGKPGAWVYLNLNYTFFAYYSGCYFFDVNIQDYSTDGCVVGKCSSPFATQCFCTHLTSFSNLFRLPKISFDITSLNINALNNSPGVMLFLVSLICLYLIVWIWARHADLQAEEKLGVVFLPGNELRDMFAYEITLWTGNTPGSGTTANVSLIVAGDEKETEPRWLCDPEPKRKAFQTGSINMFLLTTPEWLGSLSHVRVWHDNTGSHASWLLLRILVRDIYTDTKYYFIFNNWLSAEKGVGIVDRLIPVAGKQELRGIKNVFWTRGPKKLLDGHMWLSVATRPSRSRFTRVQRLTCCLVLCLTSVLFNLFGYIVQLSANEEALTSTSDPNPPIFSIGPIQISAFTLTISIISAGCSIPINMIIVLLFNERGIRNNKAEREDPYERFNHAPPGSKELTIQEQLMKEEEEQEEKEKSAINKCRDSLSSCVTACMAKIFPFPWWSHYVAYTLAFIVTVTAFMCSAILAYSNLPQAWQQENWLSSIVLTLLQSIFIIQPFTIFFIVLAFAVILRLPDEDTDEMSKEISVRRPLIEIPSDLDDGPRQVVVSKPPPYAAVTQTIREHRKKEADLRDRALSFLFFVFYLMLLMYAMNFFVSPWRYNQQHETTQKLRLQYPYQNQDNVLGAIEVWQYLQLVVLPRLYATNSSNTTMRTYSLPLPGSYTPDGSSILLGARLRQVRVEANKCTVPNLLTSAVPSCYGELSPFNSDDSDYGPNWVPIPLSAPVNSSTSSPFTYNNSAGGYVVILDSSLSDNLATLMNLSASGWIDARSRTIFIEFLAYNPSTMLYTVGYSQILLNPIEIVYNPQIYPLNLNRYEGANGSVCLLSDLLVLVGLVIFVVKTMLAWCSDEKAFCKDSWEVFDLAISAVGITTVSVYGAQVAGSMYAESLIMQSPMQFTNLQVLCCFDQASVALFGFFVFMMCIRLLRYLRIYKLMKFVFKMMEFAGAAFVGATVQLLLILLAFISAFFLIYAANAEQYSTFTSAFGSLMSTFVSKYSFAPIMLYQAQLGCLLFTIYVIMVLFIITRGFASIVLWSRRYVRLASLDDGLENPLNFVLWKCKLFCGCAEASEDDINFVYLTGGFDYEDLMRNFEQKFSDLSVKVKSTVGNRSFGDAEKSAGVKRDEDPWLYQNPIISAV